MVQRPKLVLPLRSLDKIIEGVCVLMLVSAWILATYYWSRVPAEIPVHFNIFGEADAYGQKRMIFLLPSVCTALYVLLTIVNQFPHAFNYPVPITQVNAEYQYPLATRVIRILKMLLIGIFAVGVVLTSQTALGRNVVGLKLVILIFMVGIVGVLPYTIFASQRRR